ncbi:hypothetical protein MKX03_031723, partial [Papaver bracteatum]
EGNPIILDVVRKNEQILLKDQSRNYEYLPITGLAEFNKASAKLIFGADSYSTKKSNHRAMRSVFGALRVGAEFLVKHHDNVNIFSIAGLSLEYYRYYEPTTHGLDFEGLLEDLNSASTGSVVLLHACAHNPTGVDPTLDQWQQIRQLVRSKGLLPFFDTAYQGFASGNLDVDAKSVRMFVADGGECLAAQSYAKNMSLYSERVGALNIVCKSADVVGKVESQLKLSFVQPMDYGEMTNRVIKMRQLLFDALTTRGTPGDWSHIVKQIGFFTYAGLTSEQFAFITKDYHVYMTSDGRISISGLSSKTVPLLADAIHAAVTC